MSHSVDAYGCGKVPANVGRNDNWTFRERKEPRLDQKDYLSRKAAGAVRWGETALPEFAPANAALVIAARTK